MTNSIKIDRRLFLSSSLLALAGCARCPDSIRIFKGPGVTPIIDAHAHLFNASDLPVANFVKYTFLREVTPAAKGLVEAIVDLFAFVVKPLAVTVKMELWGLRASSMKIQVARPGIDTVDVSKDTYSEKLSARIMKFTTAPGNKSEAIDSSDRASSLEDSYRQLKEALLLQSPEKEFSKDLEEGSIQHLRDAVRSFLDEEVPISPFEKSDPDKPDRLCVDENGNPRSGPDAPGLSPLQTLKWGYIMLQSRCSHLNRYMNTYSNERGQVRVLTNHLVDMDHWLRDRPSFLSGHLAQIDLMHTIAEKYKDYLSIRNFAGFDPLRLAYDVSGNRKSHFSKLTDAYTDGKIQGFKLYPPMGFYPWGNDENTNYVGDDGIRKQAVHDWCKKDRFDASRQKVTMGEAIQNSLETFYNFCNANNVPFMAHAIPSNAPAENFEERSNPVCWEKVVAPKNWPNLRFSLGHFTNDPLRFICKVNKTPLIPGKEPNKELWEFDGTAKLLARRPDKSLSKVFADLGYMNEFLAGSDTDGENLSTLFFRSLRIYCNKYDQGCNQIIYGTDWIMLGNVSSHQRYQRIMLKGLEDSGFSTLEQENILWRNSLRLLGMKESEFRTIPAMTI